MKHLQGATVTVSFCQKPKANSQQLTYQKTDAKSNFCLYFWICLL